MKIAKKLKSIKFLIIIGFILLTTIYLAFLHYGYAKKPKTGYTRIQNTNNQYNSTKVHANLKKCKNYYDNVALNETIRYNYSIEADKKLHDIRIVRGIIIYFPIDKYSTFFQEFRWLYRSWIEMQKYEPELWRTDLIFFMNKKLSIENKVLASFEELDCKTSNLRKSSNDKPMCTIIDFLSINDRVLENVNETYFKTIKPIDLYPHLFHEVDVFNQNDSNLWKFYAKLRDLKNYSYIDSILIAFDGYKYFKNQFDFFLRSDMDVFLTPMFAKWLPLNCFDFVVGGGGYGDEFNMKRIQKAAKNINLEPGDVWNLGSTWYSTPDQVRLVSYLTLVSMIYLSNEEFTKVEREGKLGVMLWPG